MVATRWWLRLLFLSDAVFKFIFQFLLRAGIAFPGQFFKPRDKYMLSRHSDLQDTEFRIL